ncbi:MAG: hydrolase [Myxococcales bacterium]|nr:hydrolase [Myxococcales bacterium]
MDWAGDIQGVFFDMDGTLLDSEHLTDGAIEQVAKAKGLELAVDCSRFHGVTWQETAETLIRLEPRLDDPNLVEDLQASFHTEMLRAPPQEIPGAVAFVRHVAARCPTALVSSSHRESVAAVVARLGLDEGFSLWVCAGDVGPSKPNPACYLEAAKRLELAPQNCLVFEDSQAGVEAGQAAGMRVIAVGKQGPGARLAPWAIDHFNELPAGFVAALGAR